MSTTTALVWAEPPAEPTRTLVWAAEAEALRASPGEWALLGEQIARSTAHHIQAGRYAAFRPAGSFQTRVSNSRGNRADVWVRFLGKRRPRR